MKLNGFFLRGLPSTVTAHPDPIDSTRTIFGTFDQQPAQTTFAPPASGTASCEDDLHLVARDEHLIPLVLTIGLCIVGLPLSAGIIFGIASAQGAFGQKTPANRGGDDAELDHDDGLGLYTSVSAETSLPVRSMPLVAARFGPLPESATIASPNEKVALVRRQTLTHKLIAAQQAQLRRVLQALERAEAIREAAAARVAVTELAAAQGGEVEAAALRAATIKLEFAEAYVDELNAARTGIDRMFAARAALAAGNPVVIGIVLGVFALVTALSIGIPIGLEVHKGKKHHGRSNRWVDQADKGKNLSLTARAAPVDPVLVAKTALKEVELASAERQIKAFKLVQDTLRANQLEETAAVRAAALKVAERNLATIQADGAADIKAAELVVQKAEEAAAGGLMELAGVGVALLGFAGLFCLIVVLPVMLIHRHGEKKKKQRGGKRDVDGSFTVAARESLEDMDGTAPSIVRWTRPKKDVDSTATTTATTISRGMEHSWTSRVDRSWRTSKDCLGPMATTLKTMTSATVSSQSEG